MDTRKLRLTENATKQARSLGLSANKIREMITDSAPHRADGVNRRFKDYGFLVGDRGVHAVVSLTQAGTAEQKLVIAKRLLIEAAQWVDEFHGDGWHREVSALLQDPE